MASPKYKRAANRKNSLIHMELLGARELEAALNGLGQDRLIKATMRRSLLKASQPVVLTAQRLAPGGQYSTGRMKGKIAASTTLARRQRRGQGYRYNPNVAYVWIGAGSRGPGVLTEFGTGPRWQRKTGKFVGAAPAQPFLRPAWDQHKHQVLDDYSKMLWVQIEKSAKRLARRNAKARAKG